MGEFPENPATLSETAATLEVVRWLLVDRSALSLNAEDRFEIPGADLVLRPARKTPLSALARSLAPSRSELRRST